MALVISDQKGNPAFGLKQVYQELMAIREASALYKRVLEVVTAYHGHGCSTKNFVKFLRNINAIRDNLVQMQMLVSNFILKADGDGVLHPMSR